MPSPAAPDQTPLRLPTFVIGPASQGRNYGVLAASSVQPGHAYDLAMMLMAWSGTGEPGFAACLPLDDPGGGAMVFRARNLGSTSLGELAFLQGVILDSAALAALDYRSEQALGAIPEPDGSLDFAASPATIDPSATLRPLAEIADLGLAWHDQLLLADGIDPEFVLHAALAGIRPAEQRPRVAGWTTSSRLSARGRIDPASDFNLIVGDPESAANVPGHVRRLVRENMVDGPTLDAPPSWRIWQMFQQRIADEKGLAALSRALVWHIHYAALSADQVAEEALRTATGVLRSERMMELLTALFADPEPALSEAAARVAKVYVEALKEHGEAAPAFGKLVDQFDSLPAEMRDLVIGQVDADMLANVDTGALRGFVDRSVSLLAEAPALRRNIIPILRRAITVFPAESPDLSRVADAVRAWPAEHARDLFALTTPDVLKTIVTKSGALSLALAEDLLKTGDDALESGDDETVPLAVTLDMIGLLQDHFS